MKADDVTVTGDGIDGKLWAYWFQNVPPGEAFAITTLVEINEGEVPKNLRLHVGYSSISGRHTAVVTVALISLKAAATGDNAWFADDVTWEPMGAGTSEDNKGES